MNIREAVDRYGLQIVANYVLGENQSAYTGGVDLRDHDGNPYLYDWFKYIDMILDELLSDVPEFEVTPDLFYKRVVQLVSWVYQHPQSKFHFDYGQMTVEQLSTLIGFAELLVENIEYVNDVTVAHRDYLGPLFAELVKPIDEYLVFQLQLSDDGIINVNQLFGERYNEAIDKYHGVEDTWAVCLELDDNVNEHYVWRFRPFAEWLVENGNDTLLTKRE